MHANLCMHILASTCQDGGNPFLVIRLPVVNSVTDLSRHTLLLPALHSQWSRQVYIIHQSITGFLVVREPTCTYPRFVLRVVVFEVFKIKRAFKVWVRFPQSPLR